MKTFIKHLHAIAILASLSVFCISPRYIMASGTGTSVYTAASAVTEIEIPEVPYVGMPARSLNYTKLGHYTVEYKLTERTSIFLWYESDIIDHEHLQCKAEVLSYSSASSKISINSVQEVKLYNKWKKYSSTSDKSNSGKKETTYSNEPSVEGFSNEEDFYDYYYYDFFDYEDAAAYYRKHGGR